MSEQGDSSARVGYAGVGRRIAAAAVDLTVLVFALMLSVWAAAPEAVSENRDLTGAEETRVGIVILLLITAAFNGFVVTEWRWGQTLGKRVFGLRVAREDGQRMTWNAALVRNLARLPDLILAPFLIPASRSRQRLGDRLAHTVVLAAGEGGVPGPELPPEPQSVPPPTTGSPQPSAASGPYAEWGPMRVLGGLLLLVALVTVEVGVVSTLDPPPGDTIDTLEAQLAVQAMLALTLVGVALAIAMPGRGLASPAALGLRRAPWRAFGIALLAFLAYVAFAAVYAPLVQPEQEDVTRDLGVGEGTLGSIAAGILIVGVAPLSEEVFFRGFMFGGLRQRAPFVVAATISGAVFGLVHYSGPDTWGVVPQLAVLGIVLAWVYERTRSLWPAISIHMVNNAIAFAVLTSS